MTSATQDFQLNASLTDCNKFMLEQEVQCDVSFRVGANDDAELISAHRYVLISRSPVFYVMFCGSLQPKQNKIVEIPDVDAKAFREMLKYLYYEEQHLDLGELGLMIMYCAKKYMIPSLLKLCVDYLKANLNFSNALLIYEQSLILDEVLLTNACLQYICTHAKTFFDNFEHFILGREALKLIVQSDSLYLPEKSIYKACVQWSRVKCEENHVESSVKDMRTVLGDIIHDIRFPLMSTTEFKKCVKDCNILTAEESLNILEYFSGDKQREMPFCNRVRHWAAANPPIPCYRFRGQGGDWDVSTGDADAIDIESDSDILLHGIFIYQGTETGASHDISIQVLSKGNNIIGKCNNISMESDGFTSEHTVRLAKPVILKGDKIYTIWTKITGSVPTYRGCSGRQHFRCNKVGLRFHDSITSANGTSVDAGQVPGIIFSII